MPYIKKICQNLNLTYLDFLEQNLFKKTDAINQILEENSRSDFSTTYKAFGGTVFSNNDFKDSFYLGHIELKSLLESQQGQKIAFDIVNHRAGKINSLFKQFKAVLEESLNNIDEGFKSNIEAIRKEVIEVYNYKNILTYDTYIEDYEKHKIQNPNKAFFRNFQTTKESYLSFLFTHSKPSQTFFKKKLEAYIPNKERYKHTYITAGTGGGKSELIKGLLYTIIQTQGQKKTLKKENFILIEPHSDLSTDVFNLCSNLGADTVLLDPFLDNELTPVINPFDFEGTETELNSYTEELLAVFKEILGTEFTLNAEALLMPCLATLLKIPNTSLYDLQSFMNDEENEELVKRGQITKNFSYKNFFETNFYSSNLNSTKRAIFLKLQTLLNNKTFSNLTTGKSTIDIEKIMNNNKNLVVKLNKKKMRGTLEPFGRFIISRVQSVALKRADITESKRPKTHLIIDEFQNFVTPTIEEILTESRKYKLFLTMAHQVISQLEESKLKDIILSNTNIKIVGKNGQKTLTALSKEIKVKVEEMENLKVGEFYAKIGNGTPFKFYHRLIESDYYHSSKQSKNQTEENKKAYYVKPTARKVIIKTDKKRHFVNKIITDKDNIPEQTRARKPKFDNF
jgi:hypothetical protein